MMLSPNYRYNYLNLANTKYLGGYYEEAIKYYRIYLNDYPNSVNARSSIASSYLNLKEYQKAIDEFEKATEPVYNFFLQLLEEGKFTDSLGREYNLDKYIIIFTSNIGKGEIGEQFPPELRSRFNYKCTLWPLSTTEKEEYLKYKSEKYLDAVKKAYVSIDKNLKAMDIIKIDVTKYSNLRDINNEIMRQIADNLYSIVVLPN